MVNGRNWAFAASSEQAFCRGASMAPIRPKAAAQPYARHVDTRPDYVGLLRLI
jgi:hypothetical protein